MNNHLHSHRFLQYLIPTLFVASIFFPSNILEKSVFEEIKCKNDNSYSFRPFDVSDKGYTWLDCDFGLRTGNAEDYSRAIDNKYSIFLEEAGLRKPSEGFKEDFVDFVPGKQSRVELVALTSEYKAIGRSIDIKRFIELFSSRFPVVAIIVSAIAFLGALAVPTKKNIKQHGETSELVTAISSALLIGGVLVAAIVWGYKTWLSWLEPRISDFRLGRSTFFSQNIYWLKPLGLSIGILIASLVTVEFIENVKIKGFKQVWKDTWAENRIELTPFKLSSLKETWSGKVVIGITTTLIVTLIVMIVIAVLAGLVGQ